MNKEENNLIYQNCKRCKNYEICESTGCAIKIEIEKMQQENTNLKQALNEIREKLKLKIKENQELIERLADTGSFRIGNAQSKIKDYQEFLQIIDKYKKEG